MGLSEDSQARPSRRLFDLAGLDQRAGHGRRNRDAFIRGRVGLFNSLGRPACVRFLHFTRVQHLPLVCFGRRASRQAWIDKSRLWIEPHEGIRAHARLAVV